MSISRQDRARHIISEQAAQWLCDLREGGEASQAAFFAWIRQSPQHVEEFLLASAIWKEMDGVGPMDATELEELARRAATHADSGVEVVTLTRASAGARIAPSSKRAMNRNARAWSAAAAVATMALTAFWQWPAVRDLLLPGQTYTTMTGEQRAVRLEDGSVVQLNTQSRVRVSLTNETRDILLLAGEALFSVEKDPTRPFRVRAGDTLIQALGTQFNVLRRADTTTVSVIEGTVQVGTQKLVAGQQASVVANGTLARRNDADVGAAVAWRERRLVFRGERLEEIAAEFNRYTPHRIDVEGEIASSKRFGGTFSADDPEALILFLRQYDDLIVEASGDGFRIRDRSEIESTVHQSPAP